MATPQSYEQLCAGGTAAVMSLLTHCTEQQLQQILNDDQRLDTMINDVPQFNSMSTEKEMLLAQNKSLAEWNMSQEPKLKEARQRLTDAYERAVQAKQQADAVSQQLEQMSNSRSLDSTLNVLKAAAAEAEEESEKAVEKLQEGEINPDEFVTQFLQHRQKSHMRKVKAEKLSELLHGQTYDNRQQARYPAAQPHRVAPTGPPQPQAWQGYPRF